MKMSHRERIEKVLTGQVPDRPPVALWRHFPVDDQTPEDLAGAITRFQNTFDFDFVKVTPASTFCLKNWGVKDEWQGSTEGTRKITSFPITNPDDWLKLTPQDPSHGSLGLQLNCLKLLRHAIPDHTPRIQTIFSPLSQAKNLVGKENLQFHLRKYPQQLKYALQVITDTTKCFIDECIAQKIDGIFYAVQQAQLDLLTEAEFSEFGVEFDLQILESIKPLWFNVCHIHGSNILYETIAKYPVQVLNWHDQETQPSLNIGKTLFSGAVCGGLRQWDTLAYGSPEQVTKESLAAIRQTEGQRFILGTGCVTPIIAPDSNLFAARFAVDGNHTI